MSPRLDRQTRCTGFRAVTDDAAVDRRRQIAGETKVLEVRRDLDEREARLVRVEPVAPEVRDDVRRTRAEFARDDAIPYALQPFAVVEHELVDAIVQCRI